MILMLVVEIPLMLPVELKIEIIFGKSEWRNFLLHEPRSFEVTWQILKVLILNNLWDKIDFLRGLQKARWIFIM